jgi:FHA domain
MLRAGESRRRMARTLSTAYGDGLLSHNTFAHRLDVLLRSGLIEPAGLVGDLTLRPPRRALADGLRRSLRSARDLAGSRWAAPSSAPTLLALDWSGAQDDLLVGRYQACDIVLTHTSVSRLHARLTFRDGNWVLRDLDSTNGTLVNGESVIRCRLLPGDVLTLGDESVLVD